MEYEVADAFIGNDDDTGSGVYRTLRVCCGRVARDRRATSNSSNGERYQRKSKRVAALSSSRLHLLAAGTVSTRERDVRAWRADSRRSYMDGSNESKTSFRRRQSRNCTRDLLAHVRAVD